MLFLALSCLQGRPMQAAASALMVLGADGLQLTAGNAPTPGFQAWLAAQGVPLRSHHGFSWKALRRPVWGEKGDCLSTADSLHPPRQGEHWWQRAEAGDYAGLVLETMYPTYLLGNGSELERAMALGLTLAVDVSHIFLQLCSGVLTGATWKRLMAYPQIAELHISANSGTFDSHQPLAPGSFGLAWVRERARDGLPVVLECYLHRLDDPQRCAQIALARQLLDGAPAQIDTVFRAGQMCPRS